MSVTRRQRSVPPGMFSDEALMELPPEVRLTGIGLRFYADDEGRGSANPVLIKASLWPLNEEITSDQIDAHLVALEDAGYIRLYTVHGRTYLVLEEWPATDRGVTSRLPAPPPPDQPALATPSRGPREELAVVEEEEERRRGEREREVGGGGGVRGAEEEPSRPSTATPSRLPTKEPSPFCSKHQPYGTERPCGACARARTMHSIWLREQTEDVQHSDEQIG